MRYAQNKSSAIEITRLSNGKPISIMLDNAKKLGEGSFGSTYYIKDPEPSKALVCKIIRLENKSQNFHFSSHHMLRLAYREASYLQKCNMLIGYYHDHKNKQMMLLMPYVPGMTEWELNKDVYPQVEYSAFCTLRSLHRLGIAHMDPHESNFIFDPNTNKTTIIDFGMAQDHQFFRELRDFYIFSRRRNDGILSLSKPWALLCGQMLAFYMDELRIYFLHHKLEMAQYFICYAVILIAALSGVGALGGVSLIAQELLKIALLQKLSEFLEMMQDHYELRAWNRQRSHSSRFYYYFFCAIFAFIQGALLALQFSRIYYHLYSLSLTIPTLTNQAYLGGYHAWQCLQQVPYTQLCLTFIEFIAAGHSYAYWKDNIEKYLMSDASIIQSYQKHIFGSRSQPYLPLFQHKKQRPPSMQIHELPLKPSKHFLVSFQRKPSQEKNDPEAITKKAYRF